MLQQGSMLSVLHHIESELPSLLKDEVAWHSLYIDYHPPYVERLWRNHGDYRINLHRIHPCESGEALFHPHPWPSAMRILSGQYEMAVGYGSGEDKPPIATTLIASQGLQYEMCDPDSWHYVRPIDEKAFTLMITGKPWSRSSPRSQSPLGPLSATQQQEIFAFFREAYPA